MSILHWSRRRFGVGFLVYLPGDGVKMQILLYSWVGEIKEQQDRVLRDKNYPFRRAFDKVRSEGGFLMLW
jgi:hypothetical protein